MGLLFFRNRHNMCSNELRSKSKIHDIQLWLTTGSSNPLQAATNFLHAWPGVVTEGTLFCTAARRAAKEIYYKVNQAVGVSSSPLWEARHAVADLEELNEHSSDW